MLKIVIGLIVLLIFLLLAISLFPYEMEEKKKNKSLITGLSSSGLSFEPLKSGLYCPLGLYSSNGLNCNRYFYTPDYIPVGDGPLSNYTAVVTETKNVPPFFGATTAKSIADSKGYLGFYYFNSQATFFSSLSINSIPLIHQPINQATIFIKKGREEEVKHNSTAFFFFNNTIQSNYWEEQVTKDKLMLKKEDKFLFLPSLPTKVISSFPLIYNREKISDINNPPSTAVSDYRVLDLSYNVSGLYVYVK